MGRQSNGRAWSYWRRHRRKSEHAGNPVRSAAAPTAAKGLTGVVLHTHRAVHNLTKVCESGRVNSATTRKRKAANVRPAPSISLVDDSRAFAHVVYMVLRSLRPDLRILRPEMAKRHWHRWPANADLAILTWNTPGMSGLEPAEKFSTHPSGDEAGPADGQCPRCDPAPGRRPSAFPFAS